MAKRKLKLVRCMLYSRDCASEQAASLLEGSFVKACFTDPQVVTSTRSAWHGGCQTALALADLRAGPLSVPAWSHSGEGAGCSGMGSRTRGQGGIRKGCLSLAPAGGTFRRAGTLLSHDGYVVLCQPAAVTLAKCKESDVHCCFAR